MRPYWDIRPTCRKMCYLLEGKGQTTARMIISVKQKVTLALSDQYFLLRKIFRGIRGKSKNWCSLDHNRPMKCIITASHAVTLSHIMKSFCCRFFPVKTIRKKTPKHVSCFVVVDDLAVSVYIRTRHINRRRN